MILSLQEVLSHQQASPAYTVDVHSSSHYWHTSLLRLLLLNAPFTCWPVLCPQREPLQHPDLQLRIPSLHCQLADQDPNWSCCVNDKNRNAPQFSEIIIHRSPRTPESCHRYALLCVHTETGRDGKGDT